MFVQRLLWVTLILFLGACGGSVGGARSPEAGSMSSKEAREVLREFGAQHGLRAAPQPDPTSLPQVLDILLADETSRFEGALRFLEGKQGGDILTLRALLELSWSDGYTTVSGVLSELNRRSGLEVKRLRDREAAGSLSEAEAASLEKLETRSEAAERARMASDVLAQEHLSAGGPLASEAVRQAAAGASEPLTALAFYNLLSDKWLEYDDVMSSVRSVETEAPMVRYLTALENLKRFTRRDQARAELQEALKVQPKFVRAQAKLVVLQDDIEATYAEFMKLKALSPNHPMLALVGQLVVEEHEAALTMQKARGR